MPYKDPDKQREYQRLRQRRNSLTYRETVTTVFGGRCEHCGFVGNKYVYQIDHIVPLLRNKKERTYHDGSRMWKNLATGKVSREGLQLLCANCHAIKTQEDSKLFKFIGRPKGV